MEFPSNLGSVHETDDPEVSSDAEVDSVFSHEDREDGMDGARFSYLFNFFGLPFCLIPLMRRDNAFSLFHAKQALLIWILFFGSLLLGWMLCWISLKALWIFVLGGGVSLGLNVLGYQRVLEENDTPLPGIGGWAESWFADVVVHEEVFDDETT